MQQIGSAFGPAVLSTLATSHTDAPLGDGASTASAFTGGYQLAFRIGSGIVAVALLLAATLLRSPHHSTTCRFPSAGRQTEYARIMSPNDKSVLLISALPRVFGCGSFKW
ncbi:hypothetical protein [Streptomyces milbemycinicus]|uniref:hypothetical protein n=1 Tax=Streptomyces milbemycinicus TaxID=476552 RepID=UPI0021F81F97|nr:hypothetical protein [Streptomyces milbemycinicus]